MTKESLISFISALPKCGLHLHIEGTLEPEDKLVFAKRNGVNLKQKTVAEIKASYVFDSLATFLPPYYEGMTVLVTQQDFHDLTFSYLTRAVKENVRYAEIFFDPQAHTSRGVPFANVICGIREAIVRAEKELKIKAALIMCFLRDMEPSYAMATLMEALPYKDWIVGVGLDSNEKDNPPLKFQKVFARARAEGFQLTMHCDVDQDNTHAHIVQVLDDIGADRIDHGANVADDPKLIARVVQRGVGLTWCPISNAFVTGNSYQTKFLALRKAGVKIAVNSDDPAYMQGYINLNYLRLAEDANLTFQDLANISKDGFAIAWLPLHAKERYCAEVDAYLAQYTK